MVLEKQNYTIRLEKKCDCSHAKKRSNDVCRTEDFWGISLTGLSGIQDYVQYCTAEA